LEDVLVNLEPIDRNKSVPLYRQVEEILLAKIKSDEYHPGDAVPPERELCKELDVSRFTVRKAIQELVYKGYLYRVQGNGTFVYSKTVTSKPRSGSRRIGVILDYCDKELESRMLNGIEETLQEEQYSMIYMSSGNDYQREARNIWQMKDEGVDGLIILPAEDQKDSTVIFDLKTEGFPFVLIDRRLQDCETDCVMSDNIDGGYRATEHLIKLGHERIAFVKNQFTQTSSIEDRIIGYKSALREYSLDYDHRWVFSIDPRMSREESCAAFYAFYEELSPTAVVAVNDYVALDIVQICREKGITIPDDLSIIGFDNLDVVRHLPVPLTTVAQFPKEIGRCAARLLMEKIKAGPGSRERSVIRQVVYPVELVARDSCCVR
jgi:GntR family transcriptional regulator of arabinose operon